MSFLSGLFSKKEMETVALIDIGSASVGGAYARFSKKSVPEIHYTARVSIEPAAGEEAERAMERALTELCEQMVIEGGPALQRSAGESHIQTVLVTVAAPWQETKVGVKTIETGKVFTFSHSMMSEAIREFADVPKGRKATDTSIIATLLNGYETQKPFGKHVKRADLVTLSSTIDEAVADTVMQTVRKAFHTHHIEMRAFLPACYTTIRDLYPHEKDFFILDVSGEATDIALIKQGLMVDAHTFPQGINAITRAAHSAGIHAAKNSGPLTTLASHTTILVRSDHNAQFGSEVEKVRTSWIDGLSQTLKKFSDHHALARTIFILADEDARDFLRNALDEPSLRQLWLSDEALRIIPMQPAHFTHLIKVRGTSSGDIFLSVLALFYAKSF
jgi:hypothetical protein